MKTMVKTFALGLGMLFLGTPDTRAALAVSASFEIHAEADFYAPLEAQGAWVEVDSYGRCWHPTGVAVEWQPYCYGHWVWTDCGWYWETDEPWGWACYHYGRWVHHPRYGWVWAPGVEWAPAWVTWRSGGGYIGWAPMAPRVGLFVSVPVAPFFFVEAGRFHEVHRPSTIIVNNTTIINKTTVINNNMRSENRVFADGSSRKVMVNQGPAVADVEKATGKKFQAVPIQTAAPKTRGPQTQERRDKPAPERAATVVRPGPSQEKPERKQIDPGSKPDQPVPPVRPGPDRKPGDPTPDQASPSDHQTPPDNGQPSKGKNRGDGRGEGRGKGKGRDN